MKTFQLFFFLKQKRESGGKLADSDVKVPVKKEVSFWIGVLIVFKKLKIVYPRYLDCYFIADLYF